MPNEHHHEAEALAAAAESAARLGDAARARLYYGQAAAHEGLAVLPFRSGLKGRTFSILAVSHASLLYKAKQLETASRVTCAYLGDQLLNGWGRAKLAELLEVIWDEQVVTRAGLEYSGEELWFALRGGAIGAGTAPVDVALHYMNTANQLVYRSVEWSGKFPFRRRGVAPVEVRRTLQARATQPVVGSYRFSVRLVTTEQPSLFPEQTPKDRIDPAEVSAFVVDFLRAAADPTDDKLARFVPDKDYRSALLQLTRNLVPREAEPVREVEVTRLSDGQVETALLHQFSGLAVKAAIERDRPANPSAIEPARVAGVLRALHLDKNWLEIAGDAGVVQKCETREDVLDDVVGPMVNKRVVATGRWVTRRGKQAFLMHDLELE